MLLSQLTTIGVGGPARELVSPATSAELVEAALATWATGDEWLVLGGGSNVVIADEGFDGTVIHVATRGIERADAPGIRLTIQAGEPWDAVVEYTLAHGFSGIEALSGIPGSAGAAPIQNIGAYGQELASSLVAVDFLDYLTGDVSRLEAAELELGYRSSALKHGRRGVVLAIELALDESTESVVEYEQLAAALGVSVGDTVTAARVRETVLSLRASKGMVLDPLDSDSVSCGSFFTNPIVSENFARSLPAHAPRWLEADDRNVKLSAAWLIEQAGVTRGFSLPGSGAAISKKHTLAIVNRGGATAAQIAELARFVQAVVLAQFGVRLQVEPVAVGLRI
jgi:UDP-N-acetylmuramate dehydrogenase